MRILVLLFAISFLPHPVLATGAVCSFFMDEIGKDTPPQTEDRLSMAREFVKRKTPPTAWFNSDNKDFVLENIPAIKQIKTNLLARLKNSSVHKEKLNAEFYISEIKKALYLADKLSKNPRPLNFQVNKLVASYIAIVSREFDFNNWQNFERGYSDDANFTEGTLAGWNQVENLSSFGIYPKMIFTFKKVDETDLILAASKGVFYVGLSDTNGITYDDKVNHSALQFAAHDVENHSKSQLNSLFARHIMGSSKLLSDILQNRYSPEEKIRIHYFKEARYRIALFLVTQANDTEALMADIYAVENKKLQEALVLTVFQANHEYTDVINKDHLVNDMIQNRMWQKYSDGHFEKGKFLGLTKDDFENAQSWLKNWFESNEGRFK